ncbi:MAG: DUF721 domain-containing protein [Prolixibacteraceae bacterium]|nr:DUF721 domain-containing protein [Prolixibacteraceae bacterium]
MRKKNTQKLSDIIRTFVKEKNLQKKFDEIDVISSWEKILGKTVSSYTERVSLYNGILFVKMKSPVVKNELMMMKEDIKKRLNEEAGSEAVKKIVFT